MDIAIALAVAALLAASAWPSYLASVRKARRAEAQEALWRVLQAQEHWRGAAGSYAATLADLNLPLRSAGGLYTLALSQASAAGYEAWAEAAPGTTQADDAGCASLRARVQAGTPRFEPAGCWSQ